LDWSLLVDFLAIARAGTLSGAAISLGVNHSTVYRRLNQLEAQLGGRLFERLAQGYVLTEAGRRLLIHAEQAEVQLHAAERVLRGTDQALRGEVRLTAPENLVYEFLPGYLEVFHRTYPEIRLTLNVSNTELDLNRREADLALRATPRPPEHLVGRKIVELGWSLFAAESLLRELGRPEGIGDLASWPWIAPEAALDHLSISQWIRRNIPPERVIFRASTLIAMSRLAEAGLGVTLLPDDQIKPQLARLQAFEQAGTFGLWLLTHPDLRHTGRIKALSDLLTEQFRADHRLRRERASGVADASIAPVAGSSKELDIHVLGPPKA